MTDTKKELTWNDELSGPFWFVGLFTYGMMLVAGGVGHFMLDSVGAVFAGLFGAALLTIGFWLLYRLRSKQRERSLAADTAAVSPVIAVILMVAITVVLAATVFVLVSDIAPQHAGTPAINFDQDHGNASLQVVSASNNAFWTEIDVQGCDGKPTEGLVRAGQEVWACSGDVLVVHTPSNSIIYRATFDP